MIDEADSIDPITAYDHTPNEQSVESTPFSHLMNDQVW